MAAKEGNSLAQCNLALMYIDGDGVPQSNSEALHWINLAHLQGCEYANEMMNEYDLWNDD